MAEAVIVNPASQDRLRAFAVLFAGDPVRVFPYSEFTRPDDDIQIDILVYGLRQAEREFVAMVTNGYSEIGGQELVQYFEHGRRADAHRLQGAAQASAEMGRRLEVGSAITLPYPSGSAWPHTLFLPPPLPAHARFESGGVKLLWHVPLSDSEFDYQRAYGIPALLRGMSQAGLPWVFDECTRPILR